ncbi:hypothetical protein GZ212_11645 [Mangrovimonas sp. CR14]|uniref:hypothetical protein n=1 Tax=Mangrovimonas sp. CR14 TaxID=2706120 RepID=UPI00142490BE|nr:hypothetical protein [Mangrovimonas sp. CR14]NIK92807.1 hypothetical protein [Mangrovimonas sp. CR14]
MKRIIFKIILGAMLYFGLGTIYKSYNNYTLSSNCITESFNTHFSNLSNLKINSSYNFDKIFYCEKWDEILVTDAHYYHRILGYLTNGVLVPSYDPFQYLEGTYLVYFLKDNIIISEPISWYHEHFIFSENFKTFNYIKIKRRNAHFFYKKYEHTDYDLNTFEIIKNN